MLARIRSAADGLAAAFQRVADAINRNTERMKAARQSLELSKMRGRSRRRYYNPSTDPAPGNPLKGLGKRRKFSNRPDKPGANLKAKIAAADAQTAKRARRAARARNDLMRGDPSHPDVERDPFG